MQDNCSIVFAHGLFGDYKDTWAYKHQKSSSGDAKTVDRGSSIKSFWKRRSENSKLAPEDVKSSFWPQDLLPSQVPNSRIFSWGYDVDIDHFFSNASQATIYDHANQLAADLADEREGLEEVLTVPIPMP